MAFHPAIGLLGKKVKDNIAGAEGVVTSISFDTNGCIQAAVRSPGLTEKGELKVSWWADTQQLTVLDETPVVRPADFIVRTGCSMKPPR